MSHTPRAISRRSILHLLGAALVAAPVVNLMGCSSDADGAPSGDAGLGDAGADAGGITDTGAVDAGGAADLGATVDAGADVATATDVATVTDAGGAWITGGTAVMGSAYPDPFTTSPGTACTLHCQATIGPCHTTSPERVDVSDGNDGIPVRMSFRVLDDSCNPVPNAIVEIWHTNYRGVYSGQINTMCNRDAVDRAAMYFRGYQRTDAEGKVHFNSCFPGWYSGRAVHVHLRVMTGDYNAADNAQATVITQMLFTDEMIRQIFSEVPLYSAFGQPNTLLASDNVIGGTADKTPYLFDVSRASDGVMLASKTLIVRASTATSLCSLQGSGGGMMGP